MEISDSYFSTRASNNNVIIINLHLFYLISPYVILFNLTAVLWGKVIWYSSFRIEDTEVLRVSFKQVAPFKVFEEHC